MKNKELVILLVVLSLLVATFIFAGTVVSRPVKRFLKSVVPAEEPVTREEPLISKSPAAPQPRITDFTAAPDSAKEAPARAEKPSGKKYLAGIEFLTGFATGHLEGKGKYSMIPFFLDLDFDIKPFFKRIGINPPGLLQFVDEPFISAVTDPHGNIEVGNNFLLKIGFLPESSRIQPYFKGGAGFLYISQHTLEQGTQFNFNEYAGFGVHIFLKKIVAFTAVYRYRHLSNSDIKQPNKGINSGFGVCGLTYLF
ncbi:MAG: acyloxyacyl hydrolase [Candidatus Omnitrophica bacterium]|nr:acyloxyacyl hydrolase [Candidatus Omnitrophota bacterium]